MSPRIPELRPTVHAEDQRAIARDGKVETDRTFVHGDKLHAAFPIWSCLEQPHGMQELKAL